MSRHILYVFLVLQACEPTTTTTEPEHVDVPPTCPDVSVTVTPPEVVVNTPPPLPTSPEPWQAGFRLPYDASTDPRADALNGIPVIHVQCDFIYVAESFAGGPEVPFCGWLLPESYQMCLVGYGGLTVTCIPYGFPQPF